MHHDGTSRWSLTADVNGAAPNSMRAIESTRRSCDVDLAGGADLEIVDVREQPARAIADSVVAIPTLVERRPPPLRRLVGGLTDASVLDSGSDLGWRAGWQADGR